MKTAQAKIQKFGSLLSAMVMPNIGVFIGWGLLTALFFDKPFDNVISTCIDPIWLWDCFFIDF